MILPNKLFSYNDSILSKMPCILYNLDTPKDSSPTSASMQSHQGACRNSLMFWIVYNAL